MERARQQARQRGESDTDHQQARLDRKGTGTEGYQGVHHCTSGTCGEGAIPRKKRAKHGGWFELEGGNDARDSTPEN